MPQQRSKPRSSADAVLLAAIEKQNSARAGQKFNVLGKLYLLETKQGCIRFEQYKGPGVAQTVAADGSPDGGLVFVSEWKTLPLVHEYSEEFCPECLATCDVCNGKSIAGCIYVGCGGGGKVARGEDPCPKCTVRKAGSLAKAYCETCGGRRAVTHFEDCPACHGSGKAPCGACRGTGKRPTGRNAANDAMCASCKGTQRAGGWKMQDLAKMITGKVGSNYMVIGPVLRMVLSPLGGDFTRGEPTGSRFDQSEGAGAPGGSFLRITPGADADGLELLVIMPQLQPGQPMVPYFFGGSV